MARADIKPVLPVGRPSVRNRIVDAAYPLFAAQGVAQVGVDKIIAKSGCAKASLYNLFGSKDGLALAFLEHREEVWTREWLEKGLLKRAGTAEGRLLAVFDLFEEWFRSTEFEGCSFVNVLLETERNSPVNLAAAKHLAAIREILVRFAEEADLAEPDQLARIWHTLMKGSIVAAGEGIRSAADDARQAARVVLESWPRRQPA